MPDRVYRPVARIVRGCLRPTRLVDCAGRPAFDVGHDTIYGIRNRRRPLPLSQVAMLSLGSAAQAILSVRKRRHCADALESNGDRGHSGY
jgi:hypothetical protein